MKTVFFDVETTGTDFEKSAVVQIGAILDEGGVEIDRIDIKLRPHALAVLDSKALAVTGLTVEDLMEDPTRVTPEHGYWQFIEFCGFRPGQRIYPEHRIHRAGYNNLAFDNKMFDSLGVRAGDNYSWAKFHWPGIDVASMACAHLAHYRASFKDFKLMTVAKYMGVNIDGQAHDALFDVEVTRNLFYKIVRS